MLFKPYHIPLIREFEKVVTRRDWAENYSEPVQGSVHMASTEMFQAKEDCDCFIQIGETYQEPLGDMTDRDAQMEGDYESLEEFRESWEEINGDGSWDPGKVVTVVPITYVGENPEIPPDCRHHTCERPAVKGRFCSEECRVTFEKRKADAREARLAEERPNEGATRTNRGP